MTARIPPEKRTKILNMIEPVLTPTCTEVSAKHMESLNRRLLQAPSQATSATCAQGTRSGWMARRSLNWWAARGAWR